MPSRLRGRTITCDDCYFRRELLCAMNVDEPCPTFRPVSGSAPKPPRQAQLLEYPLLGDAEVGEHEVELDVAPAAAAPPIAARAEERTGGSVITLFETAPAPAATMVEERPLAVAAARRGDGMTLTVPLADSSQLPLEPAPSDSVPTGSGRSHRLRARIAAKYPSAAS